MKLSLPIIFIALATTGFLAFARRGASVPIRFTPEPCAVSIASVNLAKESDPAEVIEGVRAGPNLSQADVFLLQEVASEDGKPSVAEVMAKELGYFASFRPAAPGIHDQGLAIVSRYPLADFRVLPLKAWNLHFRSRRRFAVAANVATPCGDVRVWNAHLDTRINADQRIEQLRPVIDEAARHAGPRLVGGDFNSNDLYWVGNILPAPGLRSQRAAIRQALEQRGFQTPFADEVTTYPLFGQHLDWVFVSDLQPIASGVERAPFSDHHAIWAQVRVGRD